MDGFRALWAISAPTCVLRGGGGTPAPSDRPVCSIRLGEVERSAPTCELRCDIWRSNGHRQICIVGHSANCVEPLKLCQENDYAKA